MQDLVRQALAILRGIWNFRWQGLIAAWVVGLVAAVVVFRIPDQYEASARIYVDTQSILKPLMSGLTVQPNVEQQISMLSRTLISRPNIEKLIRMADLDLAEGSPLEQEDLIQRLTKDIQIRNTGRDNLYSLVYRDQESERAKRVIQSLVSIFVESSLGASRKDTDSAKTFLNEQIKQYEQKLEEAEARLKEFKLRNIEQQPDDGKSATTRLSEASAALQQAQLELREAENARDAVKAQLAEEKRNAEAGTGHSTADDAALGVSTPELDARIEAQKRSLDTLQQRFTDQHPEVIITKRLIRELEDQKKKELAELRKAAQAAAAANPAAGGNVAVQELSRMLAAAEVQVASLRTRVGEFQGRVAQTRSGLKLAPQIEAEAAQLNRDYDVYRKNYEDLVARRQSAIMSGELEVASGVADFRLIDPPRVAPEPVAPNRLLLLLGALGVAIAAGVGVAFAGSQLRPVYNDASELRTKTGLPLLGVVSMVLSDDDRRRERRMTLRFIGASGGLVGLYVLGIVAVAVLAQRAAAA